MEVSAFDYDLPEELIAQRPLPQRDGARMMVVDRASGEIRHTRFLELPKFFAPGDVLVRNETRVIPARIWGYREWKRIEFLFVRPRTPGSWEVLCRPARHVREGDRIAFTPDLKGTVVEVGPEGQRVLTFGGADVRGELQKWGYAPLPPYIKRKFKIHDNLRYQDLERYQTVYARQGRSIAAPTAGLHFTSGVLIELEQLGVRLRQASSGVAGVAPAARRRLRDLEQERRQGLWRWICLAAIAVLLIETALAGRRSSQPAVVEQGVPA